MYLGKWHGCDAAVKCLNPGLFFGGGDVNNHSAVADLLKEADMLGGCALHLTAGHSISTIPAGCPCPCRKYYDPFLILPSVLFHFGSAKACLVAPTCRRLFAAFASTQIGIC